MAQNLLFARHVVTAILVAHDGVRWLPETLECLRGQTRPVQRVVAVDNDSRDRGASLLAEALGAGNVVALPRQTGYGAAVAQALRHPAATPSGAPGAIEWVWLIHDDSAPAPDALEQLLRAVERNPFAAVLGPKIRDWLDRRIIVEVGVTIDGAGRRETGLEPRELDQGQHDGTREVLAVGSAGMLVRRDVWDQLGGFDPNLPLFRDDIDFCWRANAAGHKVLVVPAAVFYHAEASARRRRRISATGDHPRRTDRRNALYVLFANLPTGAMAFAVLRAVVGSLFRALIFLGGKQPASAWDEVAALGHVFHRSGRILRARRRRGRDRRRTYSAIRPFMARGVATRHLADMINRMMSGAGPLESAGRHHAGAVDDDEEELLSDTGFVRRVLTQPGVLLCLALAVVTVLAERSLIRGGTLGGGALIPPTGGASDLWRQYLAGWHDAGLGSADSPPPYVAVLALLATLLAGKTWLAVELLLLGCVPLAGLAAYLFARRAVSYVPAQLWIAASYALLPVATGAVAQGRLGTAVAFVLVPVIAILVARMLALTGRPARRAAFAVGLLLAVAMAFVPLIWLLAVAVGGLVAVATTGTTRQLVIAGVTPPLLLLPWTVHLVMHPSTFLLEAGLHDPGLAEPNISAPSLLLLSPGGPGMPPPWVTAGFLLAALAALSLRRRREHVAIGWGVAMFGLLIAILVSRVQLSDQPGAPSSPAWPGVALAVAAAGILLASATVAEALGELRRAGGLRRVLAVGVAVVACSTPALAAATWVIRGVDGPLARRSGDVLPAFVTASSDTGARQRTLVLRPQTDGTVGYAVLRGRPPRLGEAELAPAAPLRQRFAETVSGLVSGRGGDDGHALAAFDIGYVLVPAPVDARLVGVLDAVAGLTRVSRTEEFALWRLTDPTARVRLLAPDGTMTAIPSGRSEVRGVRLPPGPEGRVLILAESVDDGWHAELNGRPLPVVTVDGWAQGFRVPADGGTLTVTRGELLRHVTVAVQGLLVLAAFVFALPGRRADEPEDGEPPRRDKGAPRRARGHRVRRVTPSQPAGPASSVGSVPR